MLVQKVLLERAKTPESVGVSSAVIADFIRDAEENDIQIHSVMCLRHGKVAFETWRKPYTAQTPHIMYSVSKSFTSTALGFAVDEGVISLDTKLLDVFPEYRPEKYDEWLETIDVRQLVTMTAGKEVSPFVDRSSKTWVKDFVDSRWAFEPGKSWKYISENTYVICAMLTRLLGMSVTEYLTPRLFEPLGIDVPVWERDPNGIEVGGWGSYFKTEDLAKLILCYSNGGKFNGRQVIPEEWAREAVKYHADNSNDAGPDNTSGYGYFFWLSDKSCPNTWRADGMFSQFGLHFADYDASLIITADEVCEQKTRDCIWRHFPAAFIECDPDEKPSELTASMLTFKPLPDIAERPHSPLEKKIEGRVIKFNQKVLQSAVGYPMSVLCFAAVYMSADKAGGIDDVRFSFYENECTMYWREGDETNIIHCGMDGKSRQSRIKLGGIPYTADSSAAWTKNNVLEVWIRPLESVGQRRLRFVFKGDKVVLHPFSVPSLKNVASSVAYSIEHIFPNKAVFEVSRMTMENLPKVLESTCHGILK